MKICGTERVKKMCLVNNGTYTRSGFPDTRDEPTVWCKMVFDSSSRLVSLESTTNTIP